jgi:hypothetical protein
VSGGDAAVGAIVAVLLMGYGLRVLVQLGARGVGDRAPIVPEGHGGDGRAPTPSLERARWEAYARDVKGC